MARGLKVGERVTVPKILRFKRNSQEYQQGLKSVKAGQVGEIKGNGQGRSVIVDFGGIQAVISTYRLERVAEQPLAKSLPGRPKASAKTAEPTLTIPRQEKPEVIGSDSPQFIKLIANYLLRNGRTSVEAESIVEIRLSDLPNSAQEQIQALLQAKLALSHQPVTRPSARARAAEPAKAVKTGQRRGRKPKKPAVQP